MNGPIRFGHDRHELGTTNSEGVSDRVSSRSLVRMTIPKLNVHSRPAAARDTPAAVPTHSGRWHPQRAVAPTAGGGTHSGWWHPQRVVAHTAGGGTHSGDGAVEKLRAPRPRETVDLLPASTRLPARVVGRWHPWCRPPLTAAAADPRRTGHTPSRHPRRRPPSPKRAHARQQRTRPK